MNPSLFSVFGIMVSYLFVSCESLKSYPKEEVTLQPKSGSKAQALLKIRELSAGGIQITGRVSGLEPNSIHGFHIHEKGDCSDPSAINAGGHFNPDREHVHGESILNKKYEHQHAGDLGNIIANANGLAVIDITVKSPLTLYKDSKYSILGKSFVIHADPDDEKSAPAGNAGKRILCGVIDIE